VGGEMLPCGCPGPVGGLGGVMNGSGLSSSNGERSPAGGFGTSGRRAGPAGSIGLSSGGGSPAPLRSGSFLNASSLFGASLLGQPQPFGNGRQHVG
jgi:hypothetical protein